MRSIVLDTADPASITSAVSTLKRDFPTLNAVLNNAGIMRPEILASGNKVIPPTPKPSSPPTCSAPSVSPPRWIPHFLQQPAATILNVSSGLAFVPLALTPTYCATKAAIHSYTQSLRYQLKDTAIKVIEIIPPWVATELMGEVPEDPRAMPLDAYIAETMQILATDAEEICVQNVLRLRNAAKGDELAFFKTFNDAMSAAH